MHDKHASHTHTAKSLRVDAFHMGAGKGSRHTLGLTIPVAGLAERVLGVPARQKKTCERRSLPA